MRILVVDDDEHLAAAVKRGLEACDEARARTEGTGLGLAIAQTIAQQHSGCIEIENSTVGARFVVRLPAQQTRAVRAAR